MTTTPIVPDEQQRTRDMSASTDPHGYVRRPYATDTEQCMSQLGDLERWFGTAVFTDMVERYTVNAAFQARRRSIYPDTSIADARAAVAACRRSGAHELADAIAAGLAAAKPLPVADPYPGVTTVPAQPSPAATAA